MKSLVILILACFGAINCTEPAPKIAEVDPVQVFVAAINEKGNLAFESWNGKLKGVDSDSILHFRKDSKLELEDGGLAFSISAAPMQWTQADESQLASTAITGSGLRCSFGMKEKTLCSTAKME